MNARITKILSCYGTFAATLVFGCIFPRMVQDSDTAWHLATGRLVFSLKAIPTTDPWSFSADGIAWLNISWLFDVIIGLFDRIVGPYGIAIFTIIIAAATVNIAVRLSLKTGGDVLSALIIVGLAVSLLFGGINPRPQIITYMFTVATLLLAENIRAEARGWHVIVGAVISVLWVNMHGGFALGIGIIAVAALDAILKKHSESAVSLLATTVLMSVVTLINPLGIHVWDAVWRTGSSQLLGHINEWRHLFSPADSYVYVIMLAVFATSIRNRQALALYDWIVMALSFAMAIMAVRNVPVMSLMLIPAASRAVAAEIKKHKLANERSAIYSDLLEANSHKWWQAGLASVSILLLLVIAPVRHVIWPKEAAPFDGALFPVKAIEYVASHFPGTPVFNHYDFGGAFDLYSNIGVKHFIDGRAETAFPWHVTRDYLEFADQEYGWQGNGWQGMLWERKIKIIMLPLKDPMVKTLMDSRGWELAYADEKAVVLVKTGLIEKYTNHD